MRGRAWMVVTLFAAVALAGCTDDGGSDGGSETGTTTSGTTGSTTQAPPPEKRGPVTWSVEVQDNSFSPGSLTIQVGDTVEWTQVGSNPHTVTSDGGEFEDSHPQCNTQIDSLTGNCMAEGDTYEVTFDEAGGVGYHCKIHEGGGMTGTITVEAWYNSTPTQ